MSVMRPGSSHLTPGGTAERVHKKHYMLETGRAINNLSTYAKHCNFPGSAHGRNLEIHVDKTHVQVFFAGEVYLPCGCAGILR